MLLRLDPTHHISDGAELGLPLSVLRLDPAIRLTTGPSKEHRIPSNPDRGGLLLSHLQFDDRPLPERDVPPIVDLRKRRVRDYALLDGRVVQLAILLVEGAVLPTAAHPAAFQPFQGCEGGGGFRLSRDTLREGHDGQEEKGDSHPALRARAN